MYAYDQAGALVSRRQRSVETQQGGDPANTLGYNLGSLLASIHIKQSLLKDVLKDVHSDAGKAPMVLAPSSMSAVNVSTAASPIATAMPVESVAQPPDLPPVALASVPPPVALMQGLPRAAIGCEEAVESHIDGEFNGWEGETLIKLDNGEIWQQSAYHYHYHYAFHPSVIIYKAKGGSCHIRLLEDADEGVDAVRLK